MSSKSAAAHLSSYFTDYGDDTRESASPGTTTTSTELPSITLAPRVESVQLLQVAANKNKGFCGSHTELQKSNRSAEEMHAPLQGPLLPHQQWGGLEQSYYKNTLTGNIQHCHVNSAAFETQRHEFQRFGMAEDPSDFSRPQQIRRRQTNVSNTAFVNSRTLLPPESSALAVAPRQSIANEPYYQEKASNSRKRQKRIEKGSPGSDSYLGPWAPPAMEEERKALWEAEAAKIQQQRALEAVTESNVDEAALTGTESASSVKVEKTVSIFHGAMEVDYKGRSWIERPQGWKEREDDLRDYLPKRLIHTYVGHTMGVQAIRFFPTSGHLLLSASMDSHVKVWDVHNKRKCLRTYMGHSMAVRDVQWADDGKKFYTCSYDKNINLWDTEHGKIIGTYTNNKTPYCVSVHPEKNNVFIIGCQNKRAIQFDALTGEITQEYNEHLGSVNTVTFTEGGSRIITTADDKKMFVWEFGIPVVVKHIAEPHMHSMPAVQLHPSQKFIACQSMDNQIVVYEAAGRYRFQGSKRFRGHTGAGYAILPGFSTDGRFIMSGDVSGKVWFWDWKTMKNHRTLQAHDQVCMGAEWHPTTASRIATCGWDGLVKIWE